MFRKITAFALLVLCLSIGAAFFLHIQPKPGQEAEYTNLVQSTAELRSKKTLERQPARQLRREVQKDIWTLSGGKRTHFRLKSKGSDLLIQQQRKKFEIKEDLQWIEYCMQEPSSEQVRWITARQGTYFFPSHKFEALDPELTVYSHCEENLPICCPISSPLLKVAAKGVEFTAKDLLRLSGEVRLFSNQSDATESFAIADELIFSPTAGTLLLTAHAPKKVLFWQNDLELSASQVQIHRDSSTKMESIKGIGDVHFSLDVEEKQLFHEIFQRWL